MGSQQLTFDGDIELIDVGATDAGGFTIEAMAGSRFGNPVSVESTIASLLRDGSIVSKSGDENREMSIRVRVSAPDAVALALGEKRLNVAIGKRTTLAWTPPDGIGPPTVFDVLTSSLERVEDDWDLDEVRGVRTYSLRLVCLPFGRSADLVTDDSDAPPSSGGSLLYNCDSAAGWSKWSTFAGSGGETGTAITTDATFKTQGTASVRATSEYSYSYHWYSSPYYTNKNSDRVTGLSLSTGAGGYLSIDIRTSSQWTHDSSARTGLMSLWMTVGGVETQVTNFVASARDANDFVRYSWEVDPGLTVTGLRFEVRQEQQTGVASYAYYDNVTLSASASSSAAIVKSFDVAGSARTTGSLHVSSPVDSVALGSVLVATANAADVVPGFRPDMRQFVTAGSTTADTSALYDSYLTAPAAYGSSVQFEAPYSAVGAGNFSVVVSVKVTAGSLHSFGVESQLTFGGAATGSASATDASFTPSVTGWILAPIGTVRVPAVDGADSSAELRIRVKGSLPFAEVLLIPEVADFTVAECGTSSVSASGSASNLWIDSPSPSQQSGGWWRGPVTTRANARRLNLVSELTKPGLHSFTPGTMLCWCVATNAEGPSVTLSYFPAWHTHAAQ